jgi:hypothetical protein
MPAYRARRLAALNTKIDEAELSAMDGNKPPPPSDEEGMTTI